MANPRNLANIAPLFSKSTSTTIDYSGTNLKFSGTAQRLLIKTDGTQSDRFAFQSNATDGNTRLWIYPSGTGNITGVSGHASASDFTNYNAFDLAVLGGASQEVRLSSLAVGTATAYPITFRLGASEEMRLTSTGLGIGTSSPTGKLQVSSNNPEVYITDTSVSAPDSAALYLGIGAVPQYAGLIADFSNDRLNIRHNQATRATFDSSGNLGIGTSSPKIQEWRAGTYLTVANASTRGQVEIDSAVADSGSASLGALIFTYSTNTTNHKDVAIIEAISSGSTANQRGGLLNFYTKANGTASPALNMTLDSSGNLGIGTSSPVNKLSINSTSSLAASQVQISHPAGDWGLVIKRTADDAGNPNFAFLKSRSETGTQIVQGDSLGRLSWHAVTNTTGPVITQLAEIGAVNVNFTANDADSEIFFSTRTVGGILSERVRIRANGNVGIGTDSPATNLDVRGSTSATIRVGSTGNGGSGDEFGNLEFYWADPDAAEVKAKIYAKNVGNVGPGGGGAADLLFATRPASGTLDERVRITSGGNVGIGTQSPGRRLTISRATEAASEQLEIRNVGGITTGNYDGIVWTQDANGSTALASIRVNYANSGAPNMSFNLRSDSNVLFLQAGGNVGIGTTTPESYLHIAANNGATSGRLSLSGTGSASYIKMGNKDSGGTAGPYVIVVANRTLQFGVGNNHASDTGGTLTEHARITDVGNLLVGRQGRQNNGRVEALAASGEQCFVGQVASDGNSTFQGFSSAGGAATFQVTGSGNMSIAGTLTESSSITIKENINPIMNALESIISMNGYVYDRKDGTAKQRAGLIAEEVNSVLPNVVTRDEEGNPLGIQYTNLIAYLVESIKTLHKRIESLEK